MSHILESVREGRLLHLTLNRPEKRNALNTDLCRALADNADLLARSEDSSFQNKVHLAMEARGWTDVKRPGEKAENNKE